VGVGARRGSDMNQTDSLQRNRRLRFVLEERAVIRDTSPEQPIAAWTANALACFRSAST
jgi:hypothetical protein